MILETLRAVTDWLGDATYGVNAKIAALNLDAGDSVPPDVQTIADETRNGQVARQQIPANKPALMISLYEDATLVPEVMQSTRDGEVVVLIRLAVENIETDDGARDSFYIMRAVEQSLREFHRNDYAATNRTRNGILIGPCVDMRQTTVYEPTEDGTVTSALLLRYQCRETTP